MLNDSTELRKLILENPDLPLLVFAGEDANIGEYSYESCEARASKGIVLDCPNNLPNPNDDYILTDKDDLEDTLRNNLENDPEYDDCNDEEFDKVIKDKMAEYEPYWKECIIIYVD